MIFYVEIKPQILVKIGTSFFISGFSGSVRFQIFGIIEALLKQLETKWPLLGDDRYRLLHNITYYTFEFQAPLYNVKIKNNKKGID